MIRIGLIAIASLMLFVACGGGGADDSFNAYVSAQEKVIAKICSCDTDPAMCEMDNGFSATEEACVKDVLAENDTPEVRDAIDCLTDATNAYYSCINPIACDDQTTAAQDCFDTWDAATEACPEIPAAVDSAVESTCFPG